MRAVVFKLGNQEFAFDIRDVQEIVRWEESTKLPNMPNYIEGISNLRGQVIPVIDLAKKLALIVNEQSYSSSLIIIDGAANERMAIKVDEVTEILAIDDDSIEQPQDLLAYGEDNCLAGIAKSKGKLIILLDGKDILKSREILDISRGGYGEAAKQF